MSKRWLASASGCPANEGVEALLRDLAAREKACCWFIDFDLTGTVTRVRWDIRVLDDDIARQVLEKLCLLPDTLSHGPEALLERFPVPIMIRDGDTLRPPNHQELGLSQEPAAD